MPARKLALALSIDVEEEGLFCGRYPCGAPSLENIAHLPRLERVLDLGAKATFFCAHAAFASPGARRTLQKMRDGLGVEIGAHLHHWNTPPLRAGQDAGTTLANAAASAVPAGDMRAKLSALFKAANDFQGAPVDVFRMGRWDLLGRHLPMLREFGVRYDASVRPLHFFARSGPDHFDAPADPYRIKLPDGELAEVPLTCVPILKGLARPKFLRGSLRHFGALALLPVEHPLWLMKLTTRLHAARGGRALSLTWHSSEMMPGGSPRMRNAAAVDGLLSKAAAYLAWLNDNFAMEYLTISEMGRKYAADSPRALNGGDWTYA